MIWAILSRCVSSLWLSLQLQQGLSIGIAVSHALQPAPERCVSRVGEPWPTAAIPMENPYCSCKLGVPRTRAMCVELVEELLKVVAVPEGVGLAATHL